MTDPIYCYYHRHARLEITQRYGQTYAVCPECRQALAKALGPETYRANCGDYPEQWAAPRREELFAKGRKSGTTALTTYGYRLGQPSLKPANGWTWAKVVQLLKTTRRKVYLVTKVTPDKEAIRQHVKPHKLAKLGLKIEQVETFYVERSTQRDD